MKNSSSLRTLSLQFAPQLPCAFGEVTQAQILWGQGGTETLSKFRRVTALHLLVMCLEGQAEYLDANGVGFTINPGEIMLIPRRLAHAYRPTPGRGWSEIYVWFRGALPDLWWSSRFLGPGTTVLRADPLVFHARQLCDLLAAPATHSEQRISQLQSWLADLKAKSAEHAAARHAPWLAAARKELENGTMRRPELRKLAGRCGVSYESFRKIFALEAGISPGQYRLAFTIQRACQLLHTNQSLKAIATELEFSDEFHFSRTFHRSIGVPPGQYRSMIAIGPEAQGSPPGFWKKSTPAD